MKAGKVWGTTTPIFDNGVVSVHRIEIKAGSKCSKHKHEYKYNDFYVEEGVLLIHVWKNDYKLTDTTVLHKGESTSTSPGEYHQFEAETDVVAFEIYHTKLIDSDITREDVGCSTTIKGNSTLNISKQETQSDTWLKSPSSSAKVRD